MLSHIAVVSALTADSVHKYAHAVQPVTNFGTEGNDQHMAALTGGGENR
jgi:hypothetical protein